MSEDQRHQAGDSPPSDDSPAGPEAGEQADFAQSRLAERVAKEEADNKPAAKKTVGDGTVTDSEAADDSELAKARGEAAENRDLYLRAAAEAENLRKRAEEQITAAAKFAIEAFARDIADVRDALEAALADKSAAKSDGAKEAQAAPDGFELILRKLADAMARHKVLEIAPAAGAPFDPHLHQAIGVEKAESGESDNTVARLVAKGYTLHGRLLRPAAVIVAQAGE